MKITEDSVLPVTGILREAGLYPEIHRNIGRTTVFSGVEYPDDETYLPGRLPPIHHTFTATITACGTIQEEGRAAVWLCVSAPHVGYRTLVGLQCTGEGPWMAVFEEWSSVTEMFMHTEVSGTLTLVPDEESVP